MIITSSTPSTTKKTSLIPTLSLWLLPPEPHYTTLQTEIDTLSSSSSNKYYPTFLPHVTVLGGVEYNDDMENVHDVLSQLQISFQDLNGIECCFESNPPLSFEEEKEGMNRKLKYGKRISLGVDGIIGVAEDSNNNNDKNHDDNEILRWNQCCVAILKRTPTLLQAI
eukprot:15177780-Ditylum_brightwellii.AAC.1